MSHELERPVHYKDSDAVLDYSWDWEDNLVAGDQISLSSWEATPGITIDSDSNTTTTATAWLSGGTADVSYTLTNQIVTTGGRTDERSMTIKVVNR